MINKLKKIWESFYFPQTKFPKVITYSIQLLLGFILFFIYLLAVFAIPFSIFVSFNNTDIIDFPVAYIVSIFNEDWVGAIICAFVLIAFFIELVLIPYFILVYITKKKYKRKNPEEYFKNYKSKYKKYKLSFNKKLELLIYSIWFALTFLVFKGSIYKFIKLIKFDNLFGIGEGWIAVIYISIGLICLQLLSNKITKILEKTNSD